MKARTLQRREEGWEGLWCGGRGGLQWRGEKRVSPRVKGEMGTPMNRDTNERRMTVLVDCRCSVMEVLSH